MCRAVGRILTPYLRCISRSTSVTTILLAQICNCLRLRNSQQLFALGYEVPALLLTVAPDLTLSQYLVEKTNPIFLFRRVLVAEETYLEFTQGVAAGTLPAALPLHRLFKDTPGYTSSAPSLAASSVSQLRGAA